MNKFRTILRIALIVLLTALLLYSGWQLYTIWHGYQQGKDAYHAAADSFVSQAGTAAPSAEPTHRTEDGSDKPDVTPPPSSAYRFTTDTPPISVDFRALTRQYPEAVGWIYLEDSLISYPVMFHSADNLYYVYHMYDGTENAGGAIFLDFRNSTAFSDLHSVLYGHHMNNDTMFAQLVNYADQSYYDQHPCFWLLTPGGDYKLEVFSAYVTPSSSDAYTFYFDSGDYPVWLEEMASRSQITPLVTPEETDRVVTLSTCTYDYRDARFVVQCILTRTQ